jgi:aspartyl-tRNA(Asn)/glutamyl-tRNA(Gln) amidotransferase subunit B
MRCDINISLKHQSGWEGERVEIKNVLGIKFIEKAIETEINRQALIMLEGGEVKMQTRRYDAISNTTELLREKEGDTDYRYMQDPDIP